MQILVPRLLSKFWLRENFLSRFAVAVIVSRGLMRFMRGVAMLDPIWMRWLCCSVLFSWDRVCRFDPGLDQLLRQPLEGVVVKRVQNPTVVVTFLPFSHVPFIHFFDNSSIFLLASRRDRPQDDPMRPCTTSNIGTLFLKWKTPFPRIKIISSWY